MADEPTNLDVDESVFGHLLDAIPAGDTVWLEDELHPRQTSFRSEPRWIEQSPAISVLPGDVVLLREYAIVREAQDGRVLVEQIVGDEFLNDPDYYVIGNRQAEDAAPPR